MNEENGVEEMRGNLIGVVYGSAASAEKFSQFEEGHVRGHLFEGQRPEGGGTDPELALPDLHRSLGEDQVVVEGSSGIPVEVRLGASVEEEEEGMDKGFGAEFCGNEVCAPQGFAEGGFEFREGFEVFFTGGRHLEGEYEAEVPQWSSEKMGDPAGPLLEVFGVPFYGSGEYRVFSGPLFEPGIAFHDGIQVGERDKGYGEDSAGREEIEHSGEAPVRIAVGSRKGRAFKHESGGAVPVDVEAPFGIVG